MWEPPCGGVVPLSPRALEVLDEARRRLPGAGTVFPTPTGRTQPHPYMARLLHELEIDAVPHGFRSSFRDWAAECTDAPREVCELALAHVTGTGRGGRGRESDTICRPGSDQKCGTVTVSRRQPSRLWPLLSCPTRLDGVRIMLKLAPLTDIHGRYA